METDAPPTAPTPPRPDPRSHRRRLRRDRANGMLGGVCAGVAEAYDLDVVLVRVLWVVAGVLWIGVPAYLVAWIAIAPADEPGKPHHRRRDPGTFVGLVLIAIGVTIASNHLLPHGLRLDRFGGPFLLIAGGLVILLVRRRGEYEPAGAGPGPGPAPEPADATGDTPTAEDATAANLSGSDVTGAALAGAHSLTGPTTPPPLSRPAGALPEPTEPLLVPPSAWTQTQEWPSSARSRRRTARFERRAQRKRPFITPVTISILLIGAGIASLLQATGALDVNLTVVLAIGTCVVGAALITAAFFGRAHLLILVGIALLAATSIANTIDVPLRGGIGHRVYRPLHVTEIQHDYRLGVGNLEIDLRAVPLAARTTDVDAQVGIGELTVDVPSSVRVVVDAHAGAGSTLLFGRQSGGWPENDQQAIAGTGPGLLHLDLRVGVGQVRVRRFEPGGIETILGGS